MKKPRKILYLGLKAPQSKSNEIIHHCPIIQIIPESIENPVLRASINNLQHCSHIIFTSQTSVEILLKFLPLCNVEKGILNSKFIIAVGQATASFLENHNVKSDVVATNETAEGVVHELKKMNLSDAYVFWPRSALARPVISDYLKEIKVKHCECVFYNTISKTPSETINPEEYDEIVFTSPSTVDSYKKIFGYFPNKQLTCIGPVTFAYLKKIKVISSKNES